MFTTAGHARRGGPRGGRRRPASGCGCARCRARSRRNSVRSSTSAADVVGAAPSTGWRGASGSWRMPQLVELGDVRARRRHADHLVAGGGERPQLRAEQQREAHVGGGDVDEARRARLTSSAPGVAPPVQRRGAASSSKRHAAGDLAPEPAHAVARLDRRAGEPVRIGAAVAVRPGAGERGGAEAGAHRARRPRATARRAFGYAKCAASTPRWSSISVDRAVELVVDLGAGRAGRAARGVWVCEPTVDQAGRHARRASAAHDTGGAPSGKRALLLDERGREVERRRDAGGARGRAPRVGEVGGAVVEGDDDRVAGPAGSGAASASSARVEGDDPAARRRATAICSSKRSAGRSTSSPEPPPTRW